MHRAIALTTRYASHAGIATAVRNRITALMIVGAVIVPATVSADSQVTQILTNVKGLLQTVLQILITFAFVVFIWGIVKLILAGGNPQQAAQAKKTILYGIIGIAVMASIAGIVALLQAYFGIPGGGSIKIPQF